MLMPTLEPSPIGLTTHFPHPGDDVPDVVGHAAAQRHRTCRRYAGIAVDDLGTPFVHGKRARQDAGARVGYAEDLADALERAILAVLAVQGDEHDVERAFAQTPQGGGGVTRVDALVLESRTR